MKKAKELIEEATPSKSVSKVDRELKVDGKVVFSQKKGEARGSFSGRYAYLSLPN